MTIMVEIARHNRSRKCAYIKALGTPETAISVSEEDVYPTVVVRDCHVQTAIFVVVPNCRAIGSVASAVAPDERKRTLSVTFQESYVPWARTIPVATAINDHDIQAPIMVEVINNQEHW